MFVHMPRLLAVYAAPTQALLLFKVWSQKSDCPLLGLLLIDG